MKEERQDKRREEEGKNEREKQRERERERRRERKRKHPCVYVQNASVCTVMDVSVCSRDRASLCRASYLPKMNGKRGTGVETPLPACHAAVETSLPLCLVNQVWSLGVIHHASNQKRTVKMQSWRTAQKPIRPRSTRRSRQTSENSHENVYGDSFKSKMESLDDEKAALLAAKKQIIPLQSRIDKQKNYLDGVSKEIESKQKKRLEILQQLIEADQELEAANAKQMQAKQEMAMLVFEQSAENATTVNEGNPGFHSHMSGPISDQVAQHTVLSVLKSVLSTKSMGCHGVSEQLMAAGANERMLRKSARLWHRQCGHWRQGSPPLNLVPRRIASRAKWWARTKSSPMEYAYPDSAKRTPKDKKPPRGACQTPSQKRGDWRRNANRKEKVCSLLRLWIWIQIIAVSLYLSRSRIGEADNPGPAHATAKLFGEQFEAIGQWATNLTS